MKKIFITLSIFILGFVAIAQEEEPAQSYQAPRESNKYLPSAGDIAFGLNAEPFLNFIGNMFNGTEDNELNLGDNTLYFRYYLSQDAAVRAALFINTEKNINEQYVRDDAAFNLDPLSNKELIDKYTNSSKTVELKLGYQMFHNYKRFRGFYGGDLGYRYSKTTQKYEYGNQMNELNPNPSSAWGGATRTLEDIGETTNRIGVGAFAGGEFFFLPRVCIGGELGIMYYYSFKGQSYRTEETMVLTQRVEEEITIDPGDGSRTLDTTFPYSFGNLYLMFHF